MGKQHKRNLPGECQQDHRWRPLRSWVQDREWSREPGSLPSWQIGSATSSDHQTSLWSRPATEEGSPAVLRRDQRWLQLPKRHSKHWAKAANLDLGQCYQRLTEPHCYQRSHSLKRQMPTGKLRWESYCRPQLLSIAFCLPSVDKSRELRCVRGSKEELFQIHVADRTGPRPLGRWQFHQMNGVGPPWSRAQAPGRAEKPSRPLPSRRKPSWVANRTRWQECKKAQQLRSVELVGGKATVQSRCSSRPKHHLPGQRTYSRQRASGQHCQRQRSQWSPNHAVSVASPFHLHGYPETAGESP